MCRSRGLAQQDVAVCTPCSECCVCFSVSDCTFVAVVPHSATFRSGAKPRWGACSCRSLFMRQTLRGSPSSEVCTREGKLFAALAVPSLGGMGLTVLRPGMVQVSLFLRLCLLFLSTWSPVLLSEMSGVPLFVGMAICRIRERNYRTRAAPAFAFC